MISSLCWVPRGVAKSQPAITGATAQELDELRNDADALAHAERLNGSDAGSDDDGMDDNEDDDNDPVAQAAAVAAAMASGGGRPTRRPQSLEAAMAQLDMDHYDDGEEEGDGDEEALAARVLGGRAGEGDAVLFEADPYGVAGTSDDDDDSDVAAMVLRPDDLQLLAARNEDDVNALEVWVFEEADVRGSSNLYVHHDQLLPAFPLSVAWLDVRPGAAPDQRAHVAAVSSMEPAIELWDLDVLDAVEPLAALGGYARGTGPASSSSSARQRSAGGKGGKNRRRGRDLLPGSHAGAVLCLSWNSEFRNVLGSGGADGCVKVWDVSTCSAQHTLAHHAGKVQALAWSATDAPVLLTAAFDRTACLVDVRTPDGAALRWQLSGEAEAATWQLATPTAFLVSSDDGLVVSFDARAGAGSVPLFRLSAHSAPTSVLSCCPGAPSLLATGSTDKKVKLWDLAGHVPSLLATEDLHVGAVFSAAFCAQAPHLLAAAGATGTASVWDVTSSAAVARKYPQLVAR